MNDSLVHMKIQKLEDRVESLENMTLNLIGFIQERLHVDAWDDRDFVERIKQFEKEIEERRQIS